mmetsp:Transcript_21499/g.24973  ORF Transcript_21499/g.24973 Transcript_21499/m.24973 type:complete len:80 (-) Transcript_21499:123-362(-)
MNISPSNGSACNITFAATIATFLTSATASKATANANTKSRQKKGRIDVYSRIIVFMIFKVSNTKIVVTECTFKKCELAC